EYQDVVVDVMQFLEERLAACLAAGMVGSRLCIDPGFGFGKTLEHNYQLLAALPEFRRLQVPLLAGMSRKSMIGGATGRPVEQRLAGSIAAAVLAIERGASIIRTHDVPETVDALKIM